MQEAGRASCISFYGAEPYRSERGLPFFAACRRKPGETSGMGSLGEIILRLETQGYLDENPYTFPDDDVDKVIQAYQYTLKSVGMDIR